MKFNPMLKRMLLWSWIVSLPIVALGGYTLWESGQRFATFAIRYNPNPYKIQISNLIEYELASLWRRSGILFSQKR